MRLVLAVQSLEKFPMPLPDPMVLMISGFFLAMLIHAVMPWWPGWWQWCYELALLVEVVIKLFLNAKIVIGKVVWWYWCICVTCAQHFRVTSLFSFWTCQSGEVYWESWLYVMPDSNLKTSLFLSWFLSGILQEILVGFVRSIGCPVSAVSGKVGR